MATIALSRIGLDGTGADPTGDYTAASASGDKFLPGDRVFVGVLNLSGGSITVTIDSPTSCSQGSTHDVAVAIGSLSGRLIGPFPAQRFAGTDGLVAMTYSSHTSLWVKPQVI